VSESSPEYWERRALELSRTSLDTIRASATAWAATTTTLLGVFGTVAIIKGPASVSELTGGSRDAVTGLVIGAALVAFVSVLSTAFASRGPAKRYAPLTGLKLKEWSIRAARRARTALTVGQVTAIVAALLVLSAGVVATAAGLGQGPAPASPSFLVRTTEGALECGMLRQSGARMTLVDSSGAVLLDLSSGVANVKAVKSCPGP
jgi:hypothetical protein